MSTASSVVYLADVSEFQPDIKDAEYLSWSKAIIIRAIYGTDHIDNAWYNGQRRDLLHQGGARFVGIYQYIRQGQDAKAQAQALVKLLGSLRPGEKIIGDLEEGSGNQQQRWLDWSSVIDDSLGDKPWLYSGLFFAKDHDLTQYDEWVAAYQDNEPSVPHELWQFTDKLQVPGIGPCDCSIFHGSIDQLAAFAFQGKPSVAPSSSVPLLKRPDCSPFQRAVRVGVDGIWGPDTDKHADALVKAWSDEFPYGVAFAQFVVGTRGDGIWGPISKQAMRLTTANVQRGLNAMNFNPGAIDGIWGPHTDKAYETARNACLI